MLAGSFKTSDRSRHRYEGYLRCLRERGLAADPALVVEIPYGLEHCRQGVARLMEAAEPPTAIFASNDLMAIGAMGELRARSLSVPGDVSVVGFDDVPMSSYVAPRLTTVRQPVYEMGLAAARMVLDALEAGEPGRTETPDSGSRAGSQRVHHFPAQGLSGARRGEGHSVVPGTRHQGVWNETRCCASHPGRRWPLRGPPRFQAGETGICYNCPPEWADWATQLKNHPTGIGHRPAP